MKIRINIDNVSTGDKSDFEVPAYILFYPTTDLNTMYCDVNGDLDEQDWYTFLQLAKGCLDNMDDALISELADAIIEDSNKETE